nr:phage tail protein [Pectobacterium colocasium]
MTDAAYDFRIQKQQNGVWADDVQLYHSANLTPQKIGALPTSELVGLPQLFPGAVAPAGWLKCNGQQFDTAQYPVLASRYPSGFLPDLRGEFVRGWDDGRGVDTGRALLSTQGNTIQSHVHEYRDRYYIEIGNGINVAYSETAPLNYNNGIGSQGTDSDNRMWLYYDSVTSPAGDTETRPRNIAFNYIVRAA